MPDSVNKQQTYMQQVVETWILLQKILLPVPAVIFISFQASKGSGNLGVALVNGLIGVICVSVVLFPIAMVAMPLIKKIDKIDEGRIEKKIASQDVSGLLGFAFSAMRFSDWERACDAIARIGPIAVPTLILALDPAAPVLKNPYGKGISNSNLRACAAHTLGLLKDPRAVAPLIQSLGDKDPITRKWVCDSLGLLGDLQVVSALKPFAERDADETVRKAAAEAVAKLSVEPLAAGQTPPGGRGL